MSSRYLDERVFSTLHDATGIPGARGAFGEDKPPRPRFLYRLANGGELHASNANYAALPHYEARLYLAEYDGEVVEAFAEAVAELGTYRQRDEWSDEDGGGFVAVFTFTPTEA